MKYKVAIVFVVGLVLVACGGNTKSTSVAKMSDILKEQTGQSGRTCMRRSDIQGYGFHENVVAIDGRRKYYLATTVQRCHGMETSMAVVFDGPQGEFCGGGASKITNRDRSCTVSNLFEFDSREMAMEALGKAKDSAAKRLEAAASENEAP